MRRKGLSISPFFKSYSFIHIINFGLSSSRPCHVGKTSFSSINDVEQQWDRPVVGWKNVQELLVLQAWLGILNLLRGVKSRSLIPVESFVSNSEHNLHGVVFTYSLSRPVMREN